ncbi:MAG: hypothetical protein F6K50_44775 [Moorea sp. SIO3I7]|nr:hypothetical protein [Moorena sp. SIO3I7]
MAIVYPGLKENVFHFNPGDVVTVKNGEVTYLKQRSSFVQMLEDDQQDLRFSPVNIGDQLIDDNSDTARFSLMRYNNSNG